MSGDVRIEYLPSETAAIERVRRSGRYVLGPELEAFEYELAAFCEVEHAVGVGSGTDALALALAAVGVGGGEVIMPALTYIATAEAVLMAGARPRFCDVDPDTWTMTAETVEQHVSTATTAILPVHLFGNPAPMGELAEFGVRIVEDACQAIGARYQGRHVGGYGYAGALSFYPSKVLAGIGDGGAVLTDSRIVADRVRSMRNHGTDLEGREGTGPGRNSRLDEIQAAVLRERLRYVPETVRANRARAAESAQTETAMGVSSRSLCVRLDAENYGRYYDPPCHLRPAMRRFHRGSLPVAERIGRLNRVV